MRVRYRFVMAALVFAATAISGCNMLSATGQAITLIGQGLTQDAPSADKTIAGWSKTDDEVQEMGSDGQASEGGAEKSASDSEVHLI